MDDSADLPKTVLAFSTVTTVKSTPSPSPQPNKSLPPSRTSSPLNHLLPSEPGERSSDCTESPETASSAASMQSPPVSPSGLWPECEEDAFDEDGFHERIRQEAVLRRRASSMDSDVEATNFAEMPGVLMAGGRTLEASLFSTGGRFA